MRRWHAWTAYDGPLYRFVGVAVPVVAVLTLIAITVVCTLAAVGKL